MIKKNQHWIPEVYLKNFIDTSTPQNQSSYVHIFSMNKFGELEYFKKKSPSNKTLFTKTNGYSLNDDDEILRTFIEDRLAESEDQFGRIIQKLTSSKKYQITYFERSQLAEFIAFFSIRVPEKEDKISKFLEDQHRILVDIQSSNSERFKTMMKAHESCDELSDEQIESYRRILRNDEFDINVPKEQVNQLRFSIVKEIAEIIYYMKWELIESPSNLFFITNDNPVCLNDDKNPFGSLGFRSSSTVEMYFPISPFLCLKCSHKKHDGKIARKIITSEHVRKVNRLVIESCNEFVYSSHEVMKY